MRFILMVTWVRDLSRSGHAVVNVFGFVFHESSLLYYCFCCSYYQTINRFSPNIWPWPQTLTLTMEFDLDLWPWPHNIKWKDMGTWRKKNTIYHSLTLTSVTTLTYNPNLAKVKVNSHAKNQGHRSNSSNMRVHTDGRTDGLLEFVFIKEGKRNYLLVLTITAVASMPRKLGQLRPFITNLKTLKLHLEQFINAEWPTKCYP